MTHRKNRDLEAENTKLEQLWKAQVAEARAEVNQQIHYKEVAQIECGRQRAEIERCNAAVLRLTTERNAERAEVTRLTRELAAAEGQRDRNKSWEALHDAAQERAETAEQALAAESAAHTSTSHHLGRRLEAAEQALFAAKSAEEEAQELAATYLDEGRKRWEAAEARVRELEGALEDRDRARAALEAIRPVAAALDVWGNSWIDAGTTPDPDDIPEEAALFEAWKAAAGK